jgi:hypothetical protein
VEMTLQGISQILTRIGNIFASQEEQILANIKIISSSQGEREEKGIHEKHQEEDLEDFSDHPCRFIENTKESWETINGEKTLEIDIEEFPPCLSLDPSCIQERNQ